MQVSTRTRFAEILAADRWPWEKWAEFTPEVRKTVELIVYGFDPQRQLPPPKTPSPNGGNPA